jgi:DNA-binding response OmpR family regulator
MNRNQKLLIVDDNQELLDLISEFLIAENFSVTTAKSGGSALKYLSDENFDLVVSDIQMPGISGLELLKRIKTTLNTDIPVILITGHLSNENVSEAIRLGVSDFVGKPFDSYYLLKQIKYQLKKNDKTKPFRHSFKSITKKSVSFEFDLEDFFSENISTLVMIHIEHLVHMKPSVTNMIVMILEELIENAFIHGILDLPNEVRSLNHFKYMEFIKKIDKIKYSERKINLDIFYDKKKRLINIEIDDHGKGFDFESLMKVEKSLIDFAETGRGIQIVKMLCDEMRFTNKGSKVYVTKKL